jgi:hypothetical protein
MNKKDEYYISPEDVAFVRSFNKKIEDPNKEENDGIIGSVSHDDSMKCLTTNEPNRAIRYDQDKPHMDLLSPIAMFGTAQVLTKGLEKYPGSQWKKGMAWSKVIASLLRHLFKFMAGEDLDSESGLPHIDHVAANVMFLQEYYRKHKSLDDRIKTGLE